jgi:hypothetical protein
VRFTSDTTIYSSFKGDLMKKHTPILFIAILSLLLSGFTLRPSAPKAEDYNMSFHFTTTVKSNGSGTVEVEIIVSKDLVDLLNSGSSNNIDCGAFTFTFDLSDKSQGGNLHCAGTEEFADMDELINITENKLNATVGRIEIKDKHFYYDIRTGGGVSSSSSQINVEALWILVLPGTPGDNNADTVSGHTLTWDLSKTSSSTHLTAECALGGGGFLGMDTTTMMIVAAVMMSCCCVLLLIVAAVVFLVMRRKKTPSADVAAPAV